MENLLIKKSHIREFAKINVGGYKHVFVMLVSAVLACNKTVTLENVPKIYDTNVILAILQYIGKKYKYCDNSLTIFKGPVNRSAIPDDLSSTIHGSIYLFIALVIASHKGSFTTSGGCVIGTDETKSSRPEHHFFEVMEMFGINIVEDRSGVKYARYENLSPRTINIQEFVSDSSTVSSNLYSGATKAAILCSIGVRTGSVKIKHPYLKPDVTELLAFMLLIGYKISLSKDNKVLKISYPVISVGEHFVYRVMPDIAEIISFVSYAIFNHTDLELLFEDQKKVKTGLQSEFKYLKQMKVPFKWERSGLLVLGRQYPDIDPVDIVVTSNSIFSDSQPFFAIMALCSRKASKIREGIWVSRFQYAEQAQKMGFPWRIEDDTLKILPWSPFMIKQTEKVLATDLRAAFALLILSVSTQNHIIIEDFYHVHRGYGDIYEKMDLLGIDYEIR